MEVHDIKNTTVQLIYNIEYANVERLYFLNLGIMYFYSEKTSFINHHVDHRGNKDNKCEHKLNNTIFTNILNLNLVLVVFKTNNAI